MTTIIFESHATTLDNEAHISSGHFDVELSPLGRQQAKELGERYENQDFAAIFCSDLQRSYMTAELAFGDRLPIIKDARLRECDYGSWTRQTSQKIESSRADHITQPFPGGESYEQTSERMRDFLVSILDKYDNQTIMIIGHRATQYGLNYWLKAIDLQRSVTDPWQWQPGWTYQLDSMGWAKQLVDPVKTGQKTVTYRLGDKYRYLMPGTILFTHDSQTREVFGQIKIITSQPTTFSELPLVHQGHESYPTKEIQRQTFVAHYQQPINGSDPFLIISFELFRRFDNV